MPGKKAPRSVRLFFTWPDLAKKWKLEAWPRGVAEGGKAKSGLEGVCFRICCAYESIKLSSFKGCALELPFLLQFRS